MRDIIYVLVNLGDDWLYLVYRWDLRIDKLPLLGVVAVAPLSTEGLVDGKEDMACHAQGKADEAPFELSSYLVLADGGLSVSRPIDQN